jgi:hypothetical protein
MQFLVQFQVKVFACSTMFGIEAISNLYAFVKKGHQENYWPVQNLGQFVSEFLELRIIIWLDNVVMIFKLVQIQGLLHHFAIFFKTGCTLLKSIVLVIVSYI